jgi:hypothetical protein
VIKASYELAGNRRRNMRLREQTVPPQQFNPPPAAEPASATEVLHPNVLVQHGIHRARFPIGGLSVREAREHLTRIMSISPDAVAVIGGRPVDEDQRIDESVSLLSFVKPSSLRGGR